MSTWKKPLWHGECATCKATFDEGGSIKLTNLAMKHHELQNRGHETGWVAQCGCLMARFGPGPRTTVNKLLKSHQAEQDYDALDIFEAGAG